MWSGKAGATTYYDMIARDKEIVKVVLLLTGSIEGTKESVLEYIASFDKYKFLWHKDLATEYAAFMATSPSLEVWSPAGTAVCLCIPTTGLSAQPADTIHCCLYGRACHHMHQGTCSMLYTVRCLPATRATAVA